MASETGSKYSGVEGTIQFFLGALFEIIVDRVDYQHLMNSLPCDMLSSVQEREIHHIKQKDGPAAATKRILEMVKASKKPGKYQALVDALKRDYLILSKALTGHPLPDDSIQKNIIKVFSSNITERMSTIQLLPYLIRSSVIVQLEKDMVEAELRNYGNTRGAQLLLLHLPAHVENWYTEFLKALCDSGQKDLAEFIDASFTLNYITRSNTGVMKTDADAQLYLSRKEDSSDMDLSDDKIPKEVRIQGKKEEDETERKEMSLENTAYEYITSSNTGVMKTDADAQLYLSRKEDSFDTDLSDDEIPKEVRIQEEKEEDETKRKEMSLENTAYGTLENLRVQGEPGVSLKWNLKAESDQTETVFIHKKLAELAKSIGIIKTPCGSGTGFRVGPNYVMTARHVVEQFMRIIPCLQPQQPQLLDQHQLNGESVYIDFCYEQNNLPSDLNHIYYFETEIVYESVDLDTVILKLKPDMKIYPPPLTKFADVITRLSQDQSHGYFIGHSQALIKKTDKYQIVTLTQSDIDKAKKWSMDRESVDGYKGIEDQKRVLFHCSFENGAEGSPGFWFKPGFGEAYVELMLVCGYPTWIYDKYQGKTIGILNKCLIEQGVSMKSVYDDVKARNELLCKTVFGQGENLETFPQSQLLK